MFVHYAANSLKKYIVRRSYVFVFPPTLLVRRKSIRNLHFTAMSSTHSNIDTFAKLESDRFGGVTVRSKNEFDDDAATFACKLLKSMAKWSDEGKKTVWFHVSTKQSQWLPVLCANSFCFHHAYHDGDVIVMYRWLPTDQPSSVPPYAHTMVGVGGIVLNAKQELLVVLQKYGSREILKLPGGYVEPREDLSVAAIREVEEETGIKTRFLSCISFRHTHRANFNCSDLYFVVHLEPLTTDTNNDSDEVVDVQWIKINDFLQHPKVHSLNRQFITTFLQNKEKNVSIVKEDGLHPVSQQPYCFYHIADCSSKS